MPTLVLLPGMDGTGDLFAPFLDALGGDLRIQVMRYPTHQALDYEALVAMVRNALPDDDPFFILGESFSGPIAIRLAAEAPALLHGVVLCCTFARTPRPVLSLLQHLLAVAPISRPPQALLNWVLLGRFGTHALREALARAASRVAPSVLRARLRSVAAVDVSAELASLRVPCLYLQASQDRLVPKSASAHIQSVLPPVRVVHIDAPHCLLQAASAEAVRVVSSFVDEVQGHLRAASDAEHLDTPKLVLSSRESNS